MLQGLETDGWTVSESHNYDRPGQRFSRDFVLANRKYPELAVKIAYLPANAPNTPNIGIISLSTDNLSGEAATQYRQLRQWNFAKIKKEYEDIGDFFDEALKPLRVKLREETKALALRDAPVFENFVKQASPGPQGGAGGHGPRAGKGESPLRRGAIHRVRKAPDPSEPGGFSLRQGLLSGLSLGREPWPKKSPSSANRPDPLPLKAREAKSKEGFDVIYRDVLADPQAMEEMLRLTHGQPPGAGAGGRRPGEHRLRGLLKGLRRPAVAGCETPGGRREQILPLRAGESSPSFDFQALRPLLIFD